MASLTWLQEHPRIQAHLPKELHDRVLQLQQAMGIATLSQALVQILERFFAGEDVGDLLLEDIDDITATATSAPAATETRGPEPTPEDPPHRFVERVQKRAVGVFEQIKVTGQAIARSTLENLQKEVPALNPAADPPTLFATLSAAVALSESPPPVETAQNLDLGAAHDSEDPWFSPSPAASSPPADVIAPPVYGQPASGVDEFNATAQLGSRSLPSMSPVSPDPSAALPTVPREVSLPHGFRLSPRTIADMHQNLAEIRAKYPNAFIVDPACASSNALLVLMQIDRDLEARHQSPEPVSQDPPFEALNLPPPSPDPEENA